MKLTNPHATDEFPILPRALRWYAEESIDVTNFIGHDNRGLYKRFAELYGRYYWTTFEFGQALGKPTCLNYKTENRQGMWGWQDAETKLVFLYISDAYKQSRYKGGSIEVYSPGGADLNDRTFDALERFLKHVEKVCDLSKAPHGPHLAL